MPRKATAAGEGSRPGRLGGGTGGGVMTVRTIRRLMGEVEQDIARCQAVLDAEGAQVGAAWVTAMHGHRKMQRQLEIDLATALERERAEREARKAERVVTLEEARAMLVKALRGLPEADREAVIEEATGPARLALVEGE